MKSYLIRGLCLVVLIMCGIMLIFPFHSSDGWPSNADKMSNGFKGFDAANTIEGTKILERINEALSEISYLKRNNAEMRNMLLEFQGVQTEGIKGSEEKSISYSSLQVPSAIYEETRHNLEVDLKELWYNIRSHSSNINDESFSQMQEIYRTLRAHLINLRESDSYEASRQKETKDLENIVQGRIHQLQNPPNCDSAKKLLCTLNKGCGFGCQIHHVAYCLITAYGTGRTLILESRGWRYNRKGWEEVFLPLSQNCTSLGDTKKSEWSVDSLKLDPLVLQLPIVDIVKPRPQYLPVSIPSDLAPRLKKVHGEPHIWWAAQFMTYILRPKPSIRAQIETARKSMNFASPIVGIHVRRTDKIGTEAAFHPLKEYMRHAEEYFSILEKSYKMVLTKKVFVASDDPNVISEAKKSYKEPEWQILGDQSIAQSASVSRRYYGLIGIIQDVFLLSECDFLVCTFSSQVCRLAYELFQTKKPDASERFVSLDDVYYYGGGSGIIKQAYVPHQARNTKEIALEVGDKVAVAGNHWNGMSKGTNLRTRQVGLYPSYKVRNAIPELKFPETKWWKDSYDA